MFSSIMYVLFSVIIYIFTIKPCTSESSLNLYSPGELQFAEVLVKRTGDNLTLQCEMRGGGLLAPVYVWNHVPNGAELAERTYMIETNGSHGSRLVKTDLTEADSGRYVCSAPPFSVAKYILVQQPGVNSCPRDAFVCGSLCVLGAYVCDGHSDCAAAEDEAELLCGPAPCQRADRINCTTSTASSSISRCIPEAACCRTRDPLCQQPGCCDGHPRYGRREPYAEPEEPPVYDDRRAPDDYGFIQSTIYTVTACALIFMIAVVLLVSAVCKMHMKRAALRSYATARAHYGLHVAQRHRFPPCYEASTLLDGHPHEPSSPTRDDTQGAPRSPRRVAAVLGARYTQVPTQCTEVEMTGVTSTAASSPRRSVEYRSPAGALYSEGAPHLNTPHEPNHPNRLTLQLGRFQLSIPRFGRSDPRPDTPNVAEINIDDLDFVRLNSNETYTLNGRTIRLLGGNFENYPPLTGSHPPPYNEAMRYKLYGPPPEYLSRDRLNRTNSVDEEARSNVEMPPCYDELANGGNDRNGNNDGNDSNDTGSDTACGHSQIVVDRNLIIMSNIFERVCNDGIRSNDLRGFADLGEASGSSVCNVNAASSSKDNSGIIVSEISEAAANGNFNLKTSQSNDSVLRAANNNNDSANLLLGNENNGNETLNSVIDNLPAIDSDVNANDSVVASC